MIRLTLNERKLYELSTKAAAKRTVTDVMVGLAARAWASPAYPEEGKPLTHVSAGIQNTFNGFVVLNCGLLSIVTDEIEKKRRKKLISESSGYSPEEVAMDINELIKHAPALKKADTKEPVSKIRCYGDSIRYDGNTEEGFKDIETIFGDAHLEALGEVERISKLRSVFGSVYFSRCRDLTGLNLEVVGGDVHGEKLTSANGLENLRFVGGKIYYQGAEYSLSSFKKDVLGIKVKELK